MASRGWRTARGAGAFLDGFLKGQEIAGGIQKGRQDEEVRGQIAATEDDFTPRTTQVAAGDENLGAGMTALDNARSAATQGLTEGTPEYQAAIDKVQGDYQPTIDALRKDQSRPASVVYSMGTGGAFKQQDAPFSTGEVEGAKARERAGIYQKAGREDDAARVLLNASRSRDLADQDAVRGALATPANTAAKEGITGPLERESASAYRQRKAPQVIDTYLKQGNLEGAKRYRDFVDSDSGRAYVHDWSKGVRKLMIGDHNGAIATWQDLYNRQLYDDGNTVKLTPTEDGKQVQADFFDKAGKQVHSVTKPIDAFAKQAGYAMSPERLVEHQAQQEGKRTSEVAGLNKATELENLRQEGQEVRENRRDDRTMKQIEAMDRRHARTLEAKERGGGLTAAQHRSNAEIDAARDATAGLTPDEIKRRTNKTSDTGRENKEYDGTLARQVTLAARRKIGDDEMFDSPKPKPAVPAFDRADVAKRFRADKTMNMRTLGKETPHGVEVMEKGKLIGYFQ